MREFHEGAPEFEENADEYIEEEPENEILEEAHQEKVDAPDVWWAGDIR